MVWDDIVLKVTKYKLYSNEVYDTYNLIKRSVKPVKHLISLLIVNKRFKQTFRQKPLTH